MNTTNTLNHDTLAKTPDHSMPAPAVDPKTQLRTRVEARLNEMGAAIVQLGSDPAHQKRVRDIEAAMQATQSWTSGGWDRVGEMEAAQLSTWLDSTQNIGVNPLPPKDAQE